MYCEEYQRLSNSKKKDLLKGIIGELKKVNAYNLPNIYAQLLEGQSARNIIQVCVNAVAKNDFDLIEILEAVESNLEKQ